MFVGIILLKEKVAFKGRRLYTEYILFGFSGKSDNTIVANYCILYAKQYIYLEKLQSKNKNTNFNVDFRAYLSHLKYILKMEESICIKNNQKFKFDKFIIIYEICNNTRILHAFLVYFTYIYVDRNGNIFQCQNI